MQRPGRAIEQLCPGDFAGDWKLASVEPKAESVKGFLKIEATDEKKVGIKTFMQFNYFKTYDTAFLSVFNAFAGCSSCENHSEKI